MALRISDDLCGLEFPFVSEQRFLSSFNECKWAGISCNNDLCVTEIEFESNNLVGTIPMEMGLLDTLVIWGMERGGLTGPIPTTIASLTNLIFLDFDFNELTGTLPTELYTLTNLDQLDLNNNQLSGNIDGIGSLQTLEFLQIHANMFTGTVPASVGAFTNLETFTMHQTSMGGTMPASVCDLRQGNLTILISDCLNPGDSSTNITCTCCSGCF